MSATFWAFLGSFITSSILAGIETANYLMDKDENNQDNEEKLKQYFQNELKNAKNGAEKTAIRKWLRIHTKKED